MAWELTYRRQEAEANEAYPLGFTLFSPSSSLAKSRIEYMSGRGMGSEACLQYPSGSETQRSSGGGAGFVGSHLVDRLMARGDNVIVVDNFFTGSKENVMHHFGNPNFDEGKRTAETLAMDYHRGANVEALRKEPLTVYGDGKQTRSFQFVSDLVEGLMRLMEGEHVGPFNLGNPGEFTVLELAKVVQETIDPNAKIEFRPNTRGNQTSQRPKSFLVGNQRSLSAKGSLLWSKISVSVSLATKSRRPSPPLLLHQQNKSN
ncbi:unnamed protein product [Brassica rapa]|uniref:NAD-dependent epimerase/dehydratase domain-containing protein n=1 Tax=Brassica campestris TaxID=3711 RepID=A0A3P6D113_BRACM|nr:unnamed protein product [Brassica rapa]VDD16401.1 unnamed protein product [Brassica rapa]